MPKFLALDETDSIVKCLTASIDVEYIKHYKQLLEYDSNIPLIFRGMTQRKAVTLCKKQSRDFYYIDTGYIGNMQKRKDWHRVVKNDMQHTTPRYDLSPYRFEIVSKNKLYLKFRNWKKDGESILLVTPSEKPCKYYGINRDQWVEETIAKIKQHTDRPIIIRDKVIRRDRVGSGSIYNQFDEDNIFAVVTYNSIAATEAIGYGIPAFTLAPNAADAFCLKDLSLIETPLYEDEEKVKAWQYWISHCQYTSRELISGLPFKYIEEYDLK